MAGHHRPGQEVPVVARPAEVPCRRADDERSIGHARADHDVRSGVERLDDPPRAKVDVRRDGLDAGLGQRAAAVEVAELMTGGL